MSTGKEKILIVDDEPHIRKILTRQLEKLNYDCHTADDGISALKKIADHSYNLILMDINMPNICGIKVLRKINNEENGAGSKVPVIIVSGSNSADLVRTTLREGVYDYLTKPWNFEELKLTVKKALNLGRLDRENREYQRQLEKKVQERTRELADALAEIKSTYQTTILALGSALETRDTETETHCLRVAQYSLIIAENLGLSDPDFLTNIERGAYLHDIGKIGVPDAILKKAGSLSEKEWKVMKKHPEIGRRMIEGIEFLKGAVPIVYSHHERYDGSGYPQGLKGEEIPIEAKIFAAADALDAMLSDRPYRKGISFQKAKEIILSESGKQFDPKVVAALEKAPEEKLLGELDLYKG